MSKNIAIIPARGGSKRVPKKNIKLFLGKPIIAYTLETAINSNLFDEIMVSTDDSEIAGISKKFGAKIPFMRTEATSDDHATLSEVIVEILENYMQRNIEFENLCCILPTSPLISSTNIKKGYELLMNSEFTSVTPVIQFSYPILRSLSFTKNHFLKMNWPEHLKTRSQDLPPAFHDAGSFYWVNTKIFLKENTLFTERGTGLILSEKEAQDIDTNDDWELAEMKYKLLYGEKKGHI